MTLYEALRILAAVHTKEHHEIGFVICAGASPEYPATWEGSFGDYPEAWKTVRRELHLPCGDEPIAAKPDQG